MVCDFRRLLCCGIAAIAFSSDGLALWGMPQQSGNSLEETLAAVQAQVELQQKQIDELSRIVSQQQLTISRMLPEYLQVPNVQRSQVTPPPQPAPGTAVEASVVQGFRISGD